MHAHHGRSLAAVVLVLAGAGLTGCGQGEDGKASAPQLEPQVPDIRGAGDLDDPYQGLLDARFREDVEAYTGQQVTVLADVADVLSPRMFTVTAPDGADVEPLLVVATPDAGAVSPEAGDELVVAATPVDDLDTTAVAAELGPDVDPGELEPWEGDVYLHATILRPAP